MNFFDVAISLDSFLKAYKREETKSFFPYEWFHNLQEVNNEKLPPYISFFSELVNINPLEKDYNDCENLTTSGLLTQQAVCKLRLKRYLQ